MSDDKNMIELSAQSAAENNIGPQANPFKENEAGFDQWLASYYASVLDFSIEVCA